MGSIIPYIPFLFLLLSLIWIIGGAKNLILPRRKLARIKRRRRRKIFRQTSLNRIRINGLIYLALGLILLVSLKIDLGWGKRPDLITTVKNGAVNQDVLDKVTDLASNSSLPGLAIGVVDGPNQYIFSWGRGRGKANERITEETIFEIGSISKVFTGILLADAVLSGQKSLDQPVKSCFPVSDDTIPAPLEKITLKQLTTHSSGLARMPSALSMALKSFFAGIIGGNPYRGIDQEEMLGFLSKVNVTDDNGSAWNYSNFGVGLLGLCLSEDRQDSYEIRLKRVITKPLEMTDTTVRLSDTQKKAFVTGYRGFLRLGSLTIGMKNAPWRVGEGFVAAGGLRSSAKDMTAFLNACVNRSSSAIKKSVDPLFEVNTSRFIGMGWVIDYDAEKNTNIIWHNGRTGGFNSYIAFFENKPTGVYVISNSTINISKLGEEILNILWDSR